MSVNKEDMDNVYMPYIDSLNQETLYNRTGTIVALRARFGMDNVRAINVFNEAIRTEIKRSQLTKLLTRDI